jgi:Spy/CpxP family protein refolding chaperone
MLAAQTGALRFDAAVTEILTAEQIEELGELRAQRGPRENRRARPGRGPRDDREVGA